MPETKRKPTNKKTTATKRKAPPKKAPQPAIPRAVWAGVCLFFSFVALLSLFKVKGFAINWYYWIVRTLIGAGFYVMPFALFAAGIILIIKRKGKARLRVTCIILLPVIFGMLVHLFADKGLYGTNPMAMGMLMENARNGIAGGLISGNLALFFRSAFSNVGAIIFAATAFVVCLTIGANTPIEMIIDWFRPVPEPEEQLPPPSAAPPVQRQPIFQKRSGGRGVIDIPLDDNTAAVAKPEKAEEQLRMLDISLDFVPKDPVEPVKPTFEVAQAKVEKPTPTVVEPTKPVGEPIKIEEPAPSAVEAEPAKAEEVSVQEQIQQAMAADLKGGYLYPPITLLKEAKPSNNGAAAEIQECSERLVDTLNSFGIESTVINVTSGPTVTRYELQLQRGTKFSRLTNLADDIALALGTAGVRIATIPDKLAVGIEVPNVTQQMVTIREMLDNSQFKSAKSKISFAVGKDIAGNNIVGDIAKMPHMLIAGTTGSGKSVCINSILISMIYKATPEEVRLIMVDPKMIELGVYNGIPHLLIPVVTDPKKAASALNWAVSEMMKRYKLFSEQGARDLSSYNAEIKRKGEGETLPQIVIVIDELADLMFVAANEVEEAIARIAQMARAAGMHLIIATQRPSADIITGIMKANIPSRIAFAVASQINSRIILDAVGAEKLIGKGDMLYSPLGAGKPQRIQGCFITTGEVEAVVEFVKRTGQADYSQEVMEHIERQADAAEGGPMAGGGDSEDDPMLQQAIAVVVEGGQASVSMLQRRLKLGYSRAARIVDQMEERGIVGAFEGSKPRQVLITRDEWKEMAMRRKDMENM